jgi:hypothetical protein
MTQQELLQSARDIMVSGMGIDSYRTKLKQSAISLGRKPESVAKASTMRLALWVTKRTSAI